MNFYRLRILVIFIVSEQFYSICLLRAQSVADSLLSGEILSNPSQQIFNTSFTQPNIWDSSALKFLKSFNGSQSFSQSNLHGGAFNGMFSIGTQLYEGTYNLYGNPGFYTTISSQSTVAIASVPVSIAFNLVNQNGNFDWRYSSFSIGFDNQKFLEQLKTKLKSKISEQIYDQIQFPSKSIMDSLALFDEIHEKISQREFSDSLFHLRSIMDSITNLHRDSSEVSESVRDSIKNRLEYFENLESLYNKLFVLKDKYSFVEDQIENGSTIIEKEKAEIQQLQDPEVIRDKLSEYNALKFSDKLLSSVRSLNIGTNSLNESNFSTRNFMFNGLYLDFRTGKFFTSAAIGSKAQLPFSSSYINYSASWEQPRILFAKAGIGNPDSNYTQIAFTRISYSADVTTSYPGFPKSNLIALISAQRYFTKAIKFNSEIAHSDLNFKTNPSYYSSDNSLDNRVFSNTLALNCGITGNLIRQHSQASVFYNFIGPFYRALGSPYLITNSQSLELRISQNLFHDKLAITTSLQQLQAIKSVLNIPKISTTLFMAEGKYVFGKTMNSVQIRYAPTYVISDPSSTDNFDYVNEMLQLQGTFNTSVGKMSSNSIITFSMYQNHTNLADTSLKSQFTNLFFIQNMSVSSSNKIVLSCYLSGDWNNQNTMRQSSFQLSDNIRIKKSYVEFGVQTINQQAIGALAGLHLRTQLLLRKNLALEISCTYRNELSNFWQADLAQLMGNAEVSFNW